MDPANAKDLLNSIRNRCQAMQEQPLPRRVELRRQGQRILQIPPPVAVGLVLWGIRRPKCLLASAAALLATRTDIALVCPGLDVSAGELFSDKSRHAAENVQDMREKLDDRFQDLREQGFHREGEPGQRYFTIRL